MIQITSKSDTKALEKAISSLKWKVPIDESLKVLKDETDRNFDTQGFAYGLWKPLKPSTVRQRGNARPILIRSGKLRCSFKTKSNNKDGTLYNTTSYGGYHQHGTSKMVARKMVGTTDKSLKAIGVVFANYLAKQFK